MGHWQNPGRMPKGTTRRYRGLDSVEAAIRTSNTSYRRPCHQCIYGASIHCRISSCRFQDELYASASDAARKRASVNTLALKGFIVYSTDSATVDNTMVQSLTASQSATIASGSMTEIDALAINAAKQQKSLDKSLINPGGIAYSNSASAPNGIPDALQTAII